MTPNVGSNDIRMSSSVAVLLLLFISTISGEPNPNEHGSSVDGELIMKMQQRLDYLEERDQIHRDEIEALRLQTKTQQDQIDTLMTRERDIVTIEHVNKENLEKIDNLNRHIASQDTRIASQERYIASQDTRIAFLEERMQHVTESEIPPPNEGNQGRISSKPPTAGAIHRLRRAENEVMVGFSATLSKDLTHLGSNQDIVFDHVITNTGNAYNPHHGVFVAPVSGLYVFSFTILTHYGDNHLTMVVNGQIQASTFVRAVESVHDTSSLTIVFQLNQNDDVSVQNVDPDDNIGNRSIFSGFLVQQSYGVNPIVGK